MRYSSDPVDRVCLALDVISLNQANRVLDQLQKVGLRWVKCGYSLIHAPNGGTSSIANMLNERRLLETSILDAKLDDTPETMKKAVMGINSNNFPLFTVHLGSGAPSLNAIVGCKVRSLSIGVSLLTSLEDKDLPKIGYGEDSDTQEIVRKRIRAGLCAGIDKFVCSPVELVAFREDGIFQEGCEFFLPGIRPEGSLSKGQKRFMTPKDAILAGARMIIVGSPILSPGTGTSVDAFKRICDEVASAV